MSYSLQDDDFKDYVELRCLTNLPINFYGEKLRHLTVKEIIEMSDVNNDVYSQMVTPLTFTRDLFQGFEGDFNLFEILLVPEMSAYMNSVIQLLKILFDTDKVYVFEGELVVNDRLFIDKYKFEELREIVLKMNNLQKFKKKVDGEKTLTLEEIEKIEDQREKRYQMRIYENRKKEERKKNKAVSLMNVYNTVVHSGEFFDYSKPLEFNVYQLYNTFSVLHKKENHEYTMRLASSGMVTDVKKLDTNPLSKKLCQD